MNLKDAIEQVTSMIDNEFSFIYFDYENNDKLTAQQEANKQMIYMAKKSLFYSRVTKYASFLLIFLRVKGLKKLSKLSDKNIKAAKYILKNKKQLKKYVSDNILNWVLNEDSTWSNPNYESKTKIKVKPIKIEPYEKTILSQKEITEINNNINSIAKELNHDKTLNQYRNEFYKILKQRIDFKRLQNSDELIKVSHLVNETWRKNEL